METILAPFQMLFNKVLRNKSFLFLWGGQIFSQLANNALNFALAVLVFSVTKSSTSIGLLFVSIGLPAVLFGSMAGVFCDRFNKKTILVLSSLARAILVIIFLLGYTSLPVLLITVFLISTNMQLFAPAEASLIAIMINKRSLMLANSLFSFTFQASMIAGYALASLIIASFQVTGYTVVFGLSFLGFLFAAISCFLITLPVHEQPPQHVQTVKHVFHDLIDGWKFVGRNQSIMKPLGDMTTIAGAITFLFVLAPALAETLLQQKVEDATPFVLVPATVGIVFGIIGLRLIKDRFSKENLIRIGLLMTAFGIICIPLISFFPEKHLPLFMLIAGVTFFNPLVSVPAISLLQERTPAQYRGRVFGVMNMLLNSVSAFPALIIGALTDLLGVYVVVIVGGGAFFLYTLLWKKTPTDHQSTAHH